MAELQGCADCGCTDIQYTTWTEVNTGKVLDEEGPTEQIFCPRCGSDVGGMKTVGTLDPYGEVVKSVDGNELLAGVLQDMQDVGLVCPQVYLLHYGDKHEDRVQIYRNAAARQETQKHLMLHPEEVLFVEEVAVGVLPALRKYVELGLFKTAWELFVTTCEEQATYLRTSEQELLGSPVNIVGTATGRLSSSTPNIGGNPQPDGKQQGRFASEDPCYNDIPRTSDVLPRGFPYCVSCRKMTKDCECDGPQGTYYPDDPERMKEE